jgi:hypothetical protein
VQEGVGREVKMLLSGSSLYFFSKGLAISLKVQNTLICVFCPKSPETAPNVAPPFFKSYSNTSKRNKLTALEKYRNGELGRGSVHGLYTIAAAIFLLKQKAMLSFVFRRTLCFWEASTGSGLNIGVETSSYAPRPDRSR